MRVRSFVGMCTPLFWEQCEWSGYLVVSTHCNPMDTVGFSQQKYWSGLPFPPPGDLPDPGIESPFLMSPALAGRFFIGRQVFYSQGELDGLSRDAILCPVILMICRDFF